MCLYKLPTICELLIFLIRDWVMTIFPIKYLMYLSQPHHVVLQCRIVILDCFDIIYNDQLKALTTFALSLKNDNQVGAFLKLLIKYSLT
jgi:hypothetical protein